MSCLSKCSHIKRLSVINNDSVSAPCLEPESVNICSLAVLLMFNLCANKVDTDHLTVVSFYGGRGEI